HKGEITFKKMNFKPEGELFLYALNHFSSHDSEYLPFSTNQLPFIFEEDKVTPTESRRLRNLPFARRGYVFKSEDLQKYFENMDWYIPNPNYVPVVEDLTESEQEWLEKFK